MEIGQAFQTFITTLEKAQVEYDLASENIIKDQGKTTKGKFVINKRAYSKVIIPPMTENLDAATFQLLKDFAKKGGMIQAFSKPNVLDGKPDTEMETFFAENKNVHCFTELNNEVIAKYFTIPDVAFTKQGGNLFHHRRVTTDGQVLFLANSSLEEATQGTVSVAGKDAVLLNTLTGEMQDYPETADGKNIQLNFDIPPAGSLLLYVFNKKQQGFEPSAVTGQFVAMQESSAIKAVPQGKNVLTIDFCDLQLGEENFKDMHLYDAAEKVYKHHGFSSGNPWNTSVQFKNNTVSRDTFQTGGFKATYKFTVAGDFDMSDMQAVVERTELYKVTLNGKEIQSEAGKWYVDREMSVFNIGSAVRKGENSLVIDNSPFRIMAEIEQVIIMGNFTVQPATKGWTIHPPASSFTTGSWKAQGWSFYPGVVSYSKNYDISDPNTPYRVSLGEWTGTVAEVSVNGESAGIIGFEPYVADVSGKLKQGKNTIEVKVTGSNKNLLGPFHRSGGVSPKYFRDVKTYPAGNKYLQLEYGLMGDFSLEKGIIK
jgi:hypothetical protein